MPGSAVDAIDDPRLRHFDLEVDGGGDGLCILPGSLECVQRGPATVADIFGLLSAFWGQLSDRRQRRVRDLLAKGIAVHSHYSGLDLGVVFACLRSRVFALRRSRVFAGCVHGSCYVCIRGCSHLLCVLSFDNQ